MHRVMDMTFSDDECRVRTHKPPANLAAIGHMAQNPIRRAPGKQSLRLRRKAAGWDDGYLASLLVTQSLGHAIVEPLDLYNGARLRPA